MKTTKQRSSLRNLEKKLERKHQKRDFLLKICILNVLGRLLIFLTVLLNCYREWS